MFEAHIFPQNTHLGRRRRRTEYICIQKMRIKSFSFAQKTTVQK